MAVTAGPDAHTPARSPGHRYPVSVMLRARELRAAGWSYTRIRALFEREGCSPPPSLSTLHAWLAPEVVAAQRARRNPRARSARLATAKFRWPGVRGPEWRLERMRRLRALGVSDRALAIVMSHDFPDAPLSARDVSALLGAVRIRDRAETATG